MDSASSDAADGCASFVDSHNMLLMLKLSDHLHAHLTNRVRGRSFDM